MLLVVFAVVGMFFLAEQITAQQTTPPQIRPRENATFALEGTELSRRAVTEDIREEHRQQIIRYFLAQIATTPAKRDSRWQTDWYEAMLDKPLRLDPTKTYFFEIATHSGVAPSDSYTLFGPVPLGGKDFPQNFGLSFRTFLRKDE
jgi:hypothetical protein